MNWLTSISLTGVTAVTVLWSLGALGAVWLVMCRVRWYQRRALPACVLGAASTTLASYVVVEKIWRPFPDPIEVSIYVWVGVGLAALFAAVPRAVAASSIRGKVASVIATAAVVAAAACGINSIFAAYPTVADLLGMDATTRVSLGDVPGPEPGGVTGTPLDAVWSAPPTMPAEGRLTSATITPTESGFTARPAQIYLPPAYFADPRPLLPVMVLLAGQPGQPEDWLTGGKLAETMNDFAREHDGLAPVVVVADGTGSTLANPLCVDSSLGNVDTYLARDVPKWIEATFQVDPDPRSWIIGGLSYGGTCSIQMATNHPDVYPTFLDLSGQIEPTLGDHAKTVDEVFGGDEAAFDAIDPMSLLKAKKYPGSGGAFVVGADDNEYKSGQEQMYDAAEAAGMDVRYSELPGGHSFAVWSAGLAQQLPWLMQRVGLIS